MYKKLLSFQQNSYKKKYKWILNDRITYTILNVFEIFFLQDMEKFITFKLIYVYQFILKKTHRNLF